MSRTNNSREESEELAVKMMAGSGFGYFCFDSEFRLGFVRPSLAVFKTIAVPGELELSLEGNWRFENHPLSVDLDRAFPNAAPLQAPAHSEAVQAFQLASARWMEGSVIDSVRLHHEETEFRFENGLSILVENRVDGGGVAWKVEARRELRSSLVVSVACEDLEFYAHY